MLKEFVEKILELGSIRTERIDGLTYTKDNLKLVLPPQPVAIVVHTLTGLVDYLKSNFDTLDPQMLSMVVNNQTTVQIIERLDIDQGTRRQYLSVKLTDMDSFNFGRFIDVESFIIMLQSRFTPAGDRDKILKVLGNVTDSSVISFDDNGVSQAVNVKAGVSMSSVAEVPNPVTLAPFRTFTEVAQPESKFILRVKKAQGEAPLVALFEADGGAWVNEAILNIKNYLHENLPDITILA